MGLQAGLRNPSLISGDRYLPPAGSYIPISPSVLCGELLLSSERVNAMPSMQRLHEYLALVRMVLHRRGPDRDQPAILQRRIATAVFI